MRVLRIKNNPTAGSFRNYHSFINRRISALIALVAFLCLFTICTKSVFAQVKDHERFPFLGKIVSDNVNVRAGQSANFEKLGALKKDAQIVVIDKSYSWYKIKLPIYIRNYISKKFVKIIRDGVGEVTGDRVNVRAKPVLGSTVVGQANTGMLVRTLIVEKDWYEIEPLEKSYGWVLAEYVNFFSNDIPPPRVVQLPTKNIYVRKRMAEKRAREQQAAKEVKLEKFEAEGIVIGLGDKSVSKDIRHSLVIDGDTSYFLKGYRTIIDGFLQHRVVIEGYKEKEKRHNKSVILVTKIKLVL